MKKSLFLNRFLLGLVSILLPSFSAHAEPLNLDRLRHQIEAYHDSGAYERELHAISQQAMYYINQRAILNQRSGYPQKLAIVLDIDETSLSNYANMKKRQFMGTKAQLKKEELKASASAIKPTLALYRYAIKNHIAVFFITGRREDEREATIINLKKVGFIHWNGLYFKPNDYQKKSMIPFKSNTRKIITQKGYRIIASIGDQCSDILGGFTETQFKLPNPYYYLP